MFHIRETGFRLRLSGDKFENKIFKLLTGGSTAGIACSMKGYINGNKQIISIKEKNLP